MAILQKVINFFISKIIIGIVLVVGLVVVVEQIRNLIPVNGELATDIKDIIFAIADAAVAITGYVFLFKLLEKRKIDELNISSLSKNAAIGFLTGLLLQSLFIFIIYLPGYYTITKINPVTYLLPGFTQSLTSGFVAEILIVGVFFRLAEEKFGTLITLILTTVLFALLHINAKGATMLSIIATGVEAGLLLPASYVYARKLWFPIFLHFAWDFAEPGIFGGINPGISIGKNLFDGKFSGPAIITGGTKGPQNSLQGLLISLAVSLLFLWLARRKNNFLIASWRK